MHTALKDIAVVSVPAIAAGIADFDSAGPAALGIDRFEVGPGWLPDVCSGQTCLLIPVQSGPARLAFSCGGRRRDVVLKPGGIAVIPANRRVSIRWTEALSILGIWIDPLVLRDFIESEMQSIAVIDLFEGVETLFDPELFEVARQMDSALMRAGPGHKVLLDALSCVFVATLIRNHGSGRVESASAPGARLTAAKLRALRAFVVENLSRRISIAELAAVAGQSSSSLYREMRDLAGTTPAEFILLIRVRMAHHMVRDTGLPLKSVAAECGFADQAHLSRTFKKYYGLPPRLLRQKKPSEWKVVRPMQGAEHRA